MYRNMAQLETQWNPLAPVERILTEILLTEERRLYLDERIVQEYVGLYERFRQGNIDDVLIFPESVLTTKEWYEDLFSPQGSVRQINLDNIAKDFLCLIYLTEVLRESFRHNQVESTNRFLIDGERENQEHTNRDNSLIVVESLDNFLRMYGWDMTIPERDRRDRFTLFTDFPKRPIKLEEVKPIEMIVETSRFSKFVRVLSVALQEGKKMGDLNKIDPSQFSLTDKMVNHTMGGVWNTDTMGFTIAVNREFRLWDKFRKMGYPSLRQIAEYTEIPYSVLLSLREHRESPVYYKGTSLLHRIPVKVGEKLIEELETRKGKGLTMLGKEDIL